MSDQQSKEDAQKEFFEKARKGVLKYLKENGGKFNLSELHDYSLNKYFIQHQRFSQMMETFVNENLVEYDYETQDVTITDEGRQFAA